MLILLGVFKLGALIKLIPRPVTIGFTSGIAVIIFSGQITNFLGLNRCIEKATRIFCPNMKEIGLHLTTVEYVSVLNCGICMAVLPANAQVWLKVPVHLC